MRIHLLWPTVRPEVFKSTYEYWVSNADNPNRIVTKVAVNNIEASNVLAGYDCFIVGNHEGGVGFPAYELTTNYNASAPGDILILVSDDFFPPKSWDSYLFEKISEPPCAYIILDGMQPYDAEVITLPIVNHSAFVMLNKILYHKAYRHFCSDVELFYNCKELGIIKRDPPNSIIWEHRHHEIKMRIKDEFDILNLKNHDIDRATIKNRLSMALSDRLK